MSNFDETIFESDRFAPIVRFLAERRTSPVAIKNQAEALEVILGGANLLLTGGPGTGKSYLLQNFIHALGEKLSQPSRIAILAPTGKAAARFAGIARSAKTLIETSTIHRAIGLTQGSYPTHHHTNPIAADVCIVDEISMVDLGLFAALIDALPKHAQLILAGDLNQLPAVDGMPIDQSLDFLRTRRLLSHAHLTQTHRFSQAKAALYEKIAHDGLNDLDSSADFNIARGLSASDVLAAVARYAERLTFADLTGEQPDAVFAAAKDSILLTTFREGLLGSRELNRRIAAARSRDRIRPVIATRNDYRHGIFNGDFGFVVGENVVFESAAGYRSFELAALNGIESAYVLTVHKAQGSEFDSVVILFNEKGGEPPSSGITADHRLLYTAVTRAKKSVQILVTRSEDPATTSL